MHCLLQAARVELVRCQGVLEVQLLCDSRRKSGLLSRASQPLALTAKWQPKHTLPATRMKRWRPTSCSTTALQQAYSDLVRDFSDHPDAFLRMVMQAAGSQHRTR